MTGTTWTHEDAAVAADAAMDHGTPFADLWSYLPPEVAQTLVNCPQLFSALIPLTNNDRAGIKRTAVRISTRRVYAGRCLCSHSSVAADTELQVHVWPWAIAHVGASDIL